jgi:hypothetical protein
MAEEFKLPGSSYEEVSKIIQGYAQFSQPVELDEIAHVTKMHRTAISKNNKFLSSLGIIEGGALKNITPVGKRLGHALLYNQREEVISSWKEIIQGNEFFSKMLSAIRIRKTMDTASFQGHIAYSAGQPKNKATMAGAKAIIDILQDAELLTERDGQLTANDTEYKESRHIEEEASQYLSTPLNIKNNNTSNDNLTISVNDRRNISVNIEIRIDVKPNEMDNLGEKINKLLDEISGIKPSSDEK